MSHEIRCEVGSHGSSTMLMRAYCVTSARAFLTAPTLRAGSGSHVPAEVGWLGLQCFSAELIVRVMWNGWLHLWRSVRNGIIGDRARTTNQSYICVRPYHRADRGSWFQGEHGGCIMHSLRLTHSQKCTGHDNSAYEPVNVSPSQRPQAKLPHLQLSQETPPCGGGFGNLRHLPLGHHRDAQGLGS